MRDKVLVVDDMEINRERLAEILKDDYSVLTAENGRQALEVLEENKDELVLLLLDLIMPEMDGFAVLEVMKKKEYIAHIPVIVISGENSVSVERKSFDYGVADFVRKPFDNVLVKKRVKNVADLYLYRNELEKRVEQQTETLKKQNQLLHKQAERLQKSNENIIDVLGNVVEGRNLESGEHIKRVKDFTRILATRLMQDYPEYGLTSEKVNMISNASALHDVGKIAIPDNILLKPGKLTKEEFDCMKAHTTKGCEILNNIKDVWDEEYGKLSYEICRHHHEKYDGKGYPDGLVGEEIPISAQIVSIADVYDALVNKRVYKSAYPKDQAYQMILNGECGAFSPKIIECLGHVKDDFEALVE